MPRPPDPRKEPALAYLREHPSALQVEVENRFGLTHGILAMWLSRERAGASHQGPSRAKTTKVHAEALAQPPKTKPAKEKESNLVLLQGTSEPKLNPQASRPEPRPGTALRPIPATFLARHRALIEKQLTYMEENETGTREYLNAHTVYRGMLADWQCLPMIDAEKSAEGLPDLSSEEGRAQVASELASLPEGVLESALRTLKAGSL